MELVIFIIIAIITFKIITSVQYKKLEKEVLSELGFSNWNIVSNIDEYVTVKSRQSLEKYDDIKFFKENKEKLVRAEKIIQRKDQVTMILSQFLVSNVYQSRSQYH